MGLATKEEYIESLRRQKPNVYIAGEKVACIPDHPVFKTSIDSMAVTYDWAQDPKWRDQMVMKSHLLEGEDINIFNNLPVCGEEIYRKMRVLRQLTCRHMCSLRCMGVDVGSAVWIASWELDQNYGTEYHQRFREWVKKVEKHDLQVHCAVSDAKGNRKKRPSRQSDPDMYVHVVERNTKGIVLRGAKANITAVPYSHEALVIPTRNLNEEEKDYAFVCSVPVDAPGITYICRPAPSPRHPTKIERPVSSKFGVVECLMIFEDVLVPWENVYMDGEWEMARDLTVRFTNSHRTAKSACMGGRLDLMVGSGALVADYNGVESASQIRDRLTEMILSAELTYAASLAAAMEGSVHESGIYSPSPRYANAGKLHGAMRWGEIYGYLHETCGGMLVTMPGEGEFLNPETRGLMEKYLKGREGVPTEHRMRASKLAEDLVASVFSGWLMGSAINAAGSPAAERIELFRNYPLEDGKQIAREIAGIREND
jgi:4-hydroxybutyryl-CoA dehydratase/vinylacetyl-CoA-Delta-isomerase